MKSTYLFFIGLFFICLPSAYSQNQEIEIDDLRKDWLVYDQSSSTFSPYLPTVNSDAIYFDVDANIYPTFDLKIKAEPNHYIFINSRLVADTSTGSTFYFSIDSLLNTISESYLRVSIFSKTLNPAHFQTKIVDRSRLSLASKADNNSEMILRIFSEESDNFIAITIAMLGIIVFFRTVSFRTFREYFSVIGAISRRPRFELITAQSLFSIPNLSFVLLYAMIVGATFYNVLLFHPDLGSSFGLGIQKWSPRAISFLVVGIAFLLMLIKHLIIFSTTAIFFFQKIRDLHYYSYLRISLLISLALFSFSIINGIAEGRLFAQFSILFVWILSILLLMRALILYLVLNSQTNFHKIQIFAYLCSTEIIPLVFFLKIFVKH